MNCSSSPVPSVATTSAWVSPRVNSAEPWVRGSTPTSRDDLAHGLEVAAVDALAGVENVPAHDLGFELLEHAGDRAACRISVSAPSGKKCAITFSLTAATASWRSCLSHDRIGGAQVLLGEAEDFLLERLVVGDGESRGSLAAFSASLMIASITGWKWRWPNITAPSMISSDSSLASDSTIITASWVPATTRSSWLSGHLVERRIEHVFVVDEADAGAADRAHERRAGQRQRGGGRDHRHDVGIVLQVVRQRGDDHLRSQRQPSANSGRIGRSIRREVSVSFSVGRPSRLK